MDDVIDNVQTAIDAGRKIRELELAGTVHYIEGGPRLGRPFLLNPSTFAVQDMEGYLSAPVEARGAVALADAVSFVAYVNRFADPGSLIFADLTGRKFEAVLDYHRPDAVAALAPRWCRHRATFACAPTPDWATWEAANGKPMEQEAFGLFIEANLPTIAEPAGAVLLEVALTLEAKKSVDFRSAMRLEDGQTQFRYEETIEGRAGAAASSQTGSLKIPTLFTLAIEPFAGIGLRKVDARFRYRINGGKLSLWFELVRHADVLRQAFEDVTTLIREQVKVGDQPVAVLAGAAPAATTIAGK